jgi:type II secretory pathway predicted ATPase ExeA
MYYKFYKLDRPPFDNIPDPEVVFLSPSHKRSLSVLEYAIMARAGFCVVSGEVGTGKTTMVRKLLQDIGQDFEVGLVTNTQFSSFEELLKWVLLAFELPYESNDKVALYDTFTRFLIECYQNGRPVTLIIDEAHNLEAEQMEQLRMLSNVNTEKGLVLQTILVGQPELWDVLQRHELRQFAQRISYDVRLEPLPTDSMTGEYIRTRLVKAGGDPDLIDPECYPYIWLATDGIPRLINLVCDTALLYGYAEEKEKIDLGIIEQVLNDKQHSLAPIRNKGVAAEPAVKALEPSNTSESEDADERAKKVRTTFERAAARVKTPRK